MNPRILKFKSGKSRIWMDCNWLLPHSPQTNFRLPSCRSKLLPKRHNSGYLGPPSINQVPGIAHLRSRGFFWMARWPNSLTLAEASQQKTSWHRSTHLAPLWSHDEYCAGILPKRSQKIPKVQQDKTSPAPAGFHAQQVPRHVQSALHKSPGSTLRGVNQQQDHVAAIKPFNPSCIAGKVRGGSYETTIY